MQIELLPVEDEIVRLRERYDALRELGRKTVEQVWLVGESLFFLKVALPHGHFLPTLADVGMGERMAQRYMALYRAYPEIRQIVGFDTVEQALLAKPPKPEPEDNRNRRILPSRPNRAQQMEMDALASVQNVPKRMSWPPSIVPNRLEALAAKVLADEPEESLKTTIWNESVGAQAAQSVAESEAHRLSHLLEDQKRETQKLKRRLGAIKNALLRGDLHADILAKHFNAATAVRDRPTRWTIPACTDGTGVRHLSHDDRGGWCARCGAVNSSQG